MAQVVVYHGESKCSAVTGAGKPCANKGYYSVEGSVRCGVHSKKTNRVELPKNPNAAECKIDRLEKRKREVEAAAAANREAGRKGKVRLCKLRMMREPEYVSGYLNVFPNYKHQNRADGFGCKSLSPKDMGPIVHPQPGLPVAKNLENFHQGNKCFECECDEAGNPLPKFFETQKQMYEDPEPHRHKEEAKGKNAPKFSVWVRPDGTRVHLTYFESRQFYCTYYERKAIALADFKKLKNLIDRGTNIQICGYDAYDVEADDNSVEKITACYCDVSRPFGHELVLYTMLTRQPEDYPWRRYMTEKI